MADDDQNSNMNSRRQGEDSLPEPGVRVTRSRVWLALRHPETATPEGAVIMNNLTVLADRVDNLMAVVASTSSGGRKRPRSRTSSIGSTDVSSVAGGESHAGDEVGAAAAQMQANQKATKEAINNLSGPGGIHLATIYDCYLVWTEEHQAKRYVTSSKNTADPAKRFYEHCLEFFAQDSDDLLIAQHGDNPILDDLEKLTGVDAQIQLYVGLGKRHKHKDDHQQAANRRKSPRVGGSGGDSQVSQTSSQAKRRKTKKVSFTSKTIIRDSVDENDEEDDAEDE
ncbi:hypothetical protein N0V85_008652 [Neurospora sp. IMI 360204]|nr:hypothetical protein N0V85_008652 [Neurospora sp. IMI 360204]